MFGKKIKSINQLNIHHIVLVFALTCITVCIPKFSLAEDKHPAHTPSILILGDSLSAEYGITRGTGWVALLNKQLKQEKKNVAVINASISGETTAGGLNRLNNLLKFHQPHIVIIELGANDGLRGLPIQTAESNLKQIIQQSQKSGAKVLLLGMRIPPNYGQDYTQKFFNMYGKLAQAENVALIPFFLAKVADKVELFQTDRIHPNEKAQPILLENIWGELKKLLP